MAKRTDKTALRIRNIFEQSNSPSRTQWEMLNFYATANKPRWQAIGAEGSDIDVASVFSDMADYIWDNSDGSTLYANAINDAITKGVGYLVLDVDKNADNGMGEVVII